MVVLFLLVVTNVRGQSSRVTLPALRLTVREVIKSVHQQTDYLFAFDSRVFDISRTVQARATVASVEELAELITAGPEYSWLASGSYIVIHYTPRPPEKPAAPAPKPKPRTSDTYTPSEGDEAFSTRPPQPEPQKELPTEPLLNVVPKALPAPFSDYRDPDTYSPIRHAHPLLAVKTDLLYGFATLTPNIGVEVRLGTRSTVELTWGWNQLNHEGARNNNKKLNHGLARIEYRWWFCEPYNGHFVGGHIFGTKYNVGGHYVPTLFERELRYEGWAVGTGFSYGYHLALARRWSVEFQLGVGAARYDHTRFECTKCGNVIDRPKGIWFGPTRAGVDLIFLLWR